MAYTKITNFAVKDALLHGNPNKAIKGTEIDTEFVNIESAFADYVTNAQLEPAIEAMTRLEFNNSFLNIANNLTYVNPNWTYTANGAGSLIFFDRLTGVISFYTAVSGTAGNIATLIKTGGFGNNVANFKPSVHYIEPTVGARSTPFDVAGNIGAAWESVGYTGSGAANIWTALDGINITNAVYVEVRGRISAADPASHTADAHLYARRNTDSSSASTQTSIAQSYIFASGATAVESTQWYTAKIPVNAGMFDLYLYLTATSTCGMYLAGVGY